MFVTRTTMNLHIDLLGVPKVLLGSQTVELPPKSLALVAYLLIEGRSKRDLLAKTFWPNVSANPRNNLSQERASLIRHLGHDVLTGDNESLEIAEVILCDALSFSQHYQSDPRAAWSLYRGDFLKDLEFHPRLLGDRAFGEEFEGWLAQQRASFDGRWRQLAFTMALEEVKRGAFDQAIPLLEATQHSEHAISEDAARILMLCHGVLGQSDQATSVFSLTTLRLQDELGVTPMRLTREVFELARDAPRECLARLRETVSGPASPPPRPKRLEGDAVKFVGRQHDLDVVLETLAGAALRVQTNDASSNVRCALVLGEPGVGKTRLIEETLEHFQIRDQPPGITPQTDWWLVTARASPDQVPLRMFQKAARTIVTQTPRILDQLNAVTRAALARFLPETLEADMVVIPPDLEQRALFSALRIVFSNQQRPTLLVLEDLHWADENSIEFVEYLLGDAPEAGLALLATARDSEAPRAHLDRFKTTIRNHRFGLIHSLDGLSQDAVAELASTVGKTELDSLELHRRTGGNPLFVLELLQGESAGRQRLTELILERVRACGELGNQTLEALAILGDGNTTGVLRDVSGRGLEETIDAIQVLDAAKLIVQDETSVQFQHDLIRELLFDAIPASRRALLELRAARALRQQPILAAPHFAACRSLWDQETTTQAARSFLEAGRMFASRGASRAGLEWLDLAWDADTAIPWRFDVTIVRARVLERYGLFREASESLDRAELFLHDSSAAQRASWWNLKAQLELSAHGDHEQARVYAERALTECGDLNQPEVLIERCRSLRNLGWALRVNRDLDEAVSHLRNALMIAEALDVDEEQTATLQMLGLALIELNDVEALGILQRALTTLRENRSPLEIETLNYLGMFFERVQNDYFHAKEYFQRAYELSKFWNSSRKFVYLNNLAAMDFYFHSYSKAKSAYELSLYEYQMTGARNEYQLALIYGNLAEVEMRLGSQNQAFEYLVKARVILGDKPNKAFSADLRFYEGELWTLQGKLQSAREAYELCRSEAQVARYSRREAHAMARLTLIEPSEEMANHAIELWDTPITRAALAMVHGQYKSSIELLSEDKFEQGFVQLVLYLRTGLEKYCKGAQEYLGESLRLH
jgi:tetratricopeptide (TPR) repeat protein